MDSVDVETIGRQLDRDDWQSAGRFFDEYTSVAALENTIDHTDMIFQAVRLLGDPDARDRWRNRFRLVVVDEYQDTDPLQVRFLRALAGDGRDLVAVGDPYQSIYGFRGADVRGILDFHDEFGVGGSPAPVVVLQHTHRYGPTIGAAVRSVVHNRGALGPVDGSKYEALRSPLSRVDDSGLVEVRTFVSPTAEVEQVALLLREAHLHDDVPWTDMAVLVRSGAHLGRLQRALGAAGVPVDVAGDEVPLAIEPSVRTLLAALHAADDLRSGVAIDPGAAAALLIGPLGGLDASSLRRLGRVLRQAEPDHPRPSRRLVAEALSDPSALAAPPGTPEADAVGAARRLAALLRRAADQIGAGEPAEQVLWTLWDGTDWPDRLRRQSESGGDGALQADHDLDALCALFAEAARAEEQHAHRSVIEIATALEAQQIPADTLAQQGAPTRAVQLMTAHRAKGLEWPLVVVAGVQDGEWPDARWRSSLLQVERMGPDGLRPLPSARSLVAEERRLFYVACSRARSRLVVTAVASGADDGEQPSRFVGELHAHVHGEEGRTLPVPETRPRRALSLRGAVAELRRIGESTSSPAVRARAAAALAGVVDQQGGAHPDRWWGLRDLTSSDQPIRDPDEPLRLSGSAVSTMEECPLKWFLAREARGERGSSAAQGFGSIVHAIAAEVVRSGVDADPDQLAKHLDDIWPQLEHPAPWIGEREHEAAVDAIVRFSRWHREHGREVVAAEHEFEVQVDVDGRDVLMTGSMDRVELDGDGVHVVDLKTSKNPPQAKEIAEHAQLGFYQLAVEHGAAAGLPGADALRAVGAELVQLRNDATGAPGHPKVQAQDGPRQDEPFFAIEQLRRSVHALNEENFVATSSTKSCQYCQFQRLCPAKDEGATILVEGRLR
jgi:superfamily I DNA/RNA helicase